MLRHILLLSLLAGTLLAKPNVLLLGDSISIGYTPHVQQMLKDEAKVVRPMKEGGKKPENCAYTANGVARIDAWLGDTKWDVIHFNFGLHDLKYISKSADNKKLLPQTAKTLKKNPDARQLASMGEYVINLDKLIARLKKTNATLIFCTTTPVPKGCKGRIPGDAAIYNALAVKLMQKHCITVHDLHGYASQESVASSQIKANVHYTQKGSKLLAESVVKAIRGAIAKK